MQIHLYSIVFLVDVVKIHPKHVQQYTIDKRGVMLDHMSSQLARGNSRILA